MTPDEIRDARAHFAHQAETCEQGAREMREQAEQLGVEEGSIILIPTAVALERDAKWSQAAVEGLDALEAVQRLRGECQEVLDKMDPIICQEEHNRARHILAVLDGGEQYHVEEP